MKVNYLLKLTAAIAFAGFATMVKATDIPVNGTDRAALATAIGAAQDGDVILIQQSITIDGSQLGIGRKLTFRGVGEGIEIKAAENYTMRLLDLNPQGADGKLVFENLTFTGANNQGNDAGNEKDGGVGRVLSGVVEFNNCKITANYSVQRGGAFCILTPDGVSFNNCEITDNSSDQGGAFFIYGSSKATFNHCKFTGNHSAANRAGVFFMEGTSVTRIYNSILSENYAGVIVNPENWDTNQGDGGGVFTTAGTPTLYVEACSIIKNYTLNNHGGIMFAMGTPDLTFVNTTIADNIMHRDANSMFFIDGAGNLTFVNVTFAGNTAYVSQPGDAPGHNGPNSGNTTGIRVNNANCKIKIYNSIIAGNTSRDGGLVAVDFNIGGNAANNAAQVFEFRNSIIGNLKGLSLGQISEIPGADGCILNSYAATTTWAESDKSGIQWERGLSQIGNGQSFYSLIGSSQAVGLGDPALLANYIDPLIDQIGTVRGGAKITSGAIEYAPARLPLDNLNHIWGDNNSYNTATHTVSFAGSWNGGFGWEFDEVQDWSEFSKVTIKFTEPLITGVALHVTYTDGSIQQPKPGGGEVDAYVGKGSTQVTLALWDEYKDQVKGVYFSMQNDGDRAGAPGTAVLKDAYLIEEGYVIPYSIEQLNLFDGAWYDEDNNTVHYNNDWAYAGWTWEADGGLDVSEYDQLWIKFDASGLPQTGGGGATKLQYEVRYMDGSGGDATEVRCTNTEVSYNLSPDKKIKYIFLKSEKPGPVILTDAYLFKRDIDPVDLTITDLRWEPVNPAPKDSVVFFAKIKNNSDIASPSNTKHGVIFKVNGSVASWADGFFGPIAAGAEVEVSSRGTGSTGAFWVTGKDPKYNISAEVNDTKDILETNYTNNTLDGVLTVNGKADMVILSISWEPEEPKAGDQVIFSARVNNQGLVNTPQGIVTGIAFYVNDNVVSWSDNYTESIPASIQRYTLTANGGPNNGDGAWTATEGEFTIKAWVNDQKRYDESDFDNNIYIYSEKLQIKPTGISNVSSGYNVSVINGQLTLSGYSAAASVTVYNLLGQLIATNADIRLNEGIYIIKVQEAGQSATYKILVKA